MSLAIGYIAFHFVQRSRLQYQSSEPLDSRLFQNEIKIDEKEKGGYLGDLPNSYESQSSKQRQNDVVVDMTAQPAPNDPIALLKALAEATGALKVATAEIKGLAEKIEKLQSGHLAQ